MGTISLFMLVFLLGIRHGLDADHLAYIDGLTRYNWRMQSKTVRWVGTLFALGHGLIVALIAVLLGMGSQRFAFSDTFDVIGTWVSVISLFLIGTINGANLLRSRSGVSPFQPAGLKSRYVACFVRKTSNPLVIVLVGALFALAADTVSQTSIWAIAAGNSGNLYLPLCLGLTFLIGMMLTDTVDSWIVFRIVAHSGTIGQTASRAMGWVIVALAYGVSAYEGVTYFFPGAEVDFEIVGIALMVLLLISFAIVSVRARLKKQILICNDEE